MEYSKRERGFKKIKMTTLKEERDVNLWKNGVIKKFGVKETMNI